LGNWSHYPQLESLFQMEKELPTKVQTGWFSPMLMQRFSRLQHFGARQRAWLWMESKSKSTGHSKSRNLQLLQSIPNPLILSEKLQRKLQNPLLKSQKFQIILLLKPLKFNIWFINYKGFHYLKKKLSYPMIVLPFSLPHPNG